MLKRVGVLAFVLGAGAFLQPVAALAADRSHDQAFEHRDNVRVVEQVRGEFRYDDREDRDRDRVIRRDERVVVRTAPQYYKATSSWTRQR